MYSFLKEYSDNNPEKFNEDFIYLKKNDNVLDYVEDICKALEVIDGVEYIGASINKNENELMDAIRSESGKFVEVEISRYDLITIKFKLTSRKGGRQKSAKNGQSNKGDEIVTEYVEKNLLFPKLIDNFFFVLNGSRFYPIYQIIDLATYRTTDSLTLKTLLMPIVIREKKMETFTDIYGDTVAGPIRKIDLFKNRINYLLYYFVEKGIEETIEYFGYNKEDDEIGFCAMEDLDNPENDFSDYKLFRLSPKEDIILYIQNKVFEEDKSFAINIIDIFMGKKEEQIADPLFWKIELGKIFSRNKNSYESKADDILVSFKRILDNRTKTNLRLPIEEKEDTFAIIRWIVKNFDILKYKDNMDLCNKRLRVNEYLLYDLLLKFSTITYRLLNRNDLNIKNLRQLFSTLNPRFLIKKMGTNELLRYAGAVNAIELFNTSLKFSHRGAQGLGEGNRDVNLNYRGLHPSYIGRIALVPASAGDPGMTGTFTPFIETDGFYFSKEDLVIKKE